jgi:DNA polymerase-3 subunit chi
MDRPQIDFYVLSSPSDGARDAMACRLIDKAYQKNHRLYIHSESMSHASKLDDMLWTFRPGSFIPHEIVGQRADTNVPILIGHQSVAPDEHDVLINLTPLTPEFYSQFSRVAEFVTSDPLSRDQGRDRYRYYREQGCQLHSHEIV